MRNLKIALLFMVLVLGIGIGVCKPKAKNVVIPSNWTTEDTEAFLQSHKKDTVYMVVKGERMTKSGCGYDVWGYYIAYNKGKVGTKYTTVFKYRKGATSWDDFTRIKDIKGHHSQKTAMRKLNIKVKNKDIIAEDIWYNQ